MDMDASIDELALTTRAHNGLLNDNILTVGQLVAMEERELLRLPNFGKKSLAEIVQALAEHGLTLKPTPNQKPIEPPVKQEKPISFQEMLKRIERTYVQQQSEIRMLQRALIDSLIAFDIGIDTGFYKMHLGVIERAFEAEKRRNG